MPAKKSSRITGFRKWEQAFRVYATIYCSKNPHRSREIWQYISIINTAANSYVWDNVYSYDVVFRQLMEFNPVHSWAVTYNQMWNLSMRELFLNRGERASPHGSGDQNVSNSGKFMGRKKSDYCWAFNKGIKWKWGKNCKFTEKCKYCDSSTHGVHACPKLAEKREATGIRKPNVGKSTEEKILKKKKKF